MQQVIAAWPFLNAGPKWTPAQLVEIVVRLGFDGVELLNTEHWPLLQEKGLVCAATRSHTFIRGMNNLHHHEECISILTESIKASSEAGYPNVMTFTGLLDTSDQPKGSKVTFEEGIQNCIDGYRQIVPLAEQLGVTLILEPLNTKVDLPMKGHPGYQGDHIETCVEIIRAVDSSALKLLFDVYHIQIMDGNIIQHIEEHIDLIGHVQIAGVPGRGEIDASQEINYRAVMKTLDRLGYQGYIGHEWIPTDDAVEGLSIAHSICHID